MRIKNNISALNAQIALRINESKLTKDLEKLTSGYRINRSGDDAAGLAISEQMRSQIAGLTQGELNARDGLGLLRTGEGAMQEIHAMLIRMNGLTIRSANGVYTDEDHRELIQEEVDRISQEIDRIASATRFNYVNLFHDDKSMAEDSGLTAPGTKTDTATTAVTTSLDGIDAANTVVTAPLDKAADAANTVVTAPLDKAADAANTVVTAPLDKAAEAAEANIADAPPELPGTGAAKMKEEKIIYTQGDGASNVLQMMTGTLNQTNTVESKFDAASPRALSGGSASPTAQSSKIVFQIGPDAEHTISVPRFYLSKAALGLDHFDVSTQEKAREAMDKVDDMINYVSQIRGAYGAVDNALEHAMNSMNVYKENLTAAESRIRDTDMAKELTERTKDNILAQTAQAMLAQANALPESTLNLLR